MVIATHQLHLRTTRCVAEVAQELAHALWKFMENNREIASLDGHRFPVLVRALDQALWAHVDMCEPCSGAARCKRIGAGGADCFSAYAEHGPACEEHERRLVAEAGTELRSLFDDLEKRVRWFFSDTPEVQEPGLAKIIHEAILLAGAPCIYKNMAGSCCDECMRAADFTDPAGRLVLKASESVPLRSAGSAGMT